MVSETLKQMMPNLPMLFTRKDIEKFFGHLISPRYLANLDSEGKGPKRTRIGRKVAYTRDDWVEWIAGRVSV